MTSNNSPVHHPHRPNTSSKKTAPAEACVQGRTCYVGNVPQLMQDPDFNSLHEIMGKDLSPTIIQEGNLNNYPICRGMRMYVYIYIYIYTCILDMQIIQEILLYTIDSGSMCKRGKYLMIMFLSPKLGRQIRQDCTEKNE